MIRRSAIAVLATLALTGGAGAQGRPDTVDMSCRASARLVQAQGAVVLGTGGPRFDRFVSDHRFCEPRQFTRPAFVASRDNPQCFVGYRCRDWERDFFDY